MNLIKYVNLSLMIVFELFFEVINVNILSKLPSRLHDISRGILEWLVQIVFHRLGGVNTLIYIQNIIQFYFPLLILDRILCYIF